MIVPPYTRARRLLEQKAVYLSSMALCHQRLAKWTHENNFVYAHPIVSFSIPMADGRSQLFVFGASIIVSDIDGCNKRELLDANWELAREQALTYLDSTWLAMVLNGTDSTSAPSLETLQMLADCGANTAIVILR